MLLAPAHQTQLLWLRGEAARLHGRPDVALWRSPASSACSQTPPGTWTSSCRQRSSISTTPPPLALLHAAAIKRVIPWSWVAAAVTRQEELMSTMCSMECRSEIWIGFRYS